MVPLTGSTSAARHHQAASFVSRRDRQAWAAAANNEFARSHDEEAAIEMVNYELNCRIDEAEVEHRHRLLCAAEEAGLLSNVTDKWGRIPEEILDRGAGDELAFIRRGDDPEPYVTGQIEVSRYLTLTNVVERQRRAAGKPQ